MFALAITIVAVVLLVTPPPVAAAGAETGVTQAAAQSQSQTKPVDINTATAADLQGVPGIGEALARRIIEFRQEHGRFEKVDDLLNVRGIGVASLEKLRPYLVVNPKG